MKNEKMIDRVAKAAAQAAIDYLEAERKKREKSKHDRRLRNTKLMLRNYRNFKKHVESFPEEIQKLDSSLLNDLDVNELAVESIKRSKARTRAMVQFIDKMIAVYQFMCEQSDKPEDKRSHEAVYHLYIADEKLSAKDIATCQNTDERTVYRDVDRACKALTTLIFGIDSVKFND